MADDQPMWGNNQTVAPTPRAAIVAVDLGDNFIVKGHHFSMIKDRQFDGRSRANPHKHIAEFVEVYGIEWGDGFVGRGGASFKEERKGLGSLRVFGGVVKTRALGAKGDAKGSTMFDIGGGIVSARVVSIMAWCCCGEASLEVRSM
ncbi:hypothetical protein Tco_0103585 [Tanacetum coccineum]